MKSNKLSICILFLFSCSQSNNTIDYPSLSTYQLTDTNKLYFKKYIESHDRKHYDIALETFNILIKRDTANFDNYLNKFNLLSLSKNYKYAIAFNDSAFSKFKSDSSIAVTLLLAKGDLQQKILDKNSKLTYRKADSFAKYDIANKDDNISIDRYITYVAIGALAYNKDTVGIRIDRYKNLYPSDTSTINTLLKIASKN